MSILELSSHVHVSMMHGEQSFMVNVSPFRPFLRPLDLIIVERKSCINAIHMLVDYLSFPLDASVVWKVL